MFSDERQGQILTIVRETGFASIDMLAERFEVTPQTIRRSVNALCEMALLRRVHGGVSLLHPTQNIVYETRQILRPEEKRLIAHRVAEFIPDGASLLIGLGTTPEFVAHALSARKNLRVFTNSLNVAAALARNPDIEITMAGGTYRQHDRDIIGEAAAAFFMRFKADFAIFGVGGIDEDGTFLDFNEGEVEARKAMVASCRTAILAADVSKFGRPAPVRGGHLADIDHLFCDAPVPAAVAPVAEASGVAVHVAMRRPVRVA
jgi:DeoR family glycerol-3-phosphate regulon repressor